MVSEPSLSEAHILYGLVTGTEGVRSDVHRISPSCWEHLQYIQDLHKAKYVCC